jgi:ATP-dependent Clp protease protease subunit
MDQARMEHNGGPGAGAGLGDWLSGQALETRTILMFGACTPALAQRVSQQLLLLSARGPEDIKLLINAQGGQASDGEMLFDLLRGLRPRVLVIGAGVVAGAPALAFVAPAREQRFCLPHARFSLAQQGDTHLPAGADAATAVAAMLAYVAQQERLTRIFAEQMGQPVEQVAREVAREDWLDAEEALAHGLVGRIVTSASAV